MNPQFISITDFMLPSQVEAMRKVMKEECASPRLGVGVMVYRKTLRGIPCEWSDAVPKNKDIAKIFLPYDDVYNVLHYADYDGLTQFDDLELAVNWGGAYLHAIQFDMIWPEVWMLERLRAHCPSVDIILQVGKNAMEICENSPQKVADRLAYYYESDILDYVLLDKSMGRGLGMDANVLLPFAEEIWKRYPDVGQVYAGGTRSSHDEARRTADPSKSSLFTRRAGTTAGKWRCTLPDRLGTCGMVSASRMRILSGL